MNNKIKVSMFFIFMIMGKIFADESLNDENKNKLIALEEVSNILILFANFN